jgi:hypothetical protein
MEAVGCSAHRSTAFARTLTCALCPVASNDPGRRFTVDGPRPNRQSGCRISSLESRVYGSVHGRESTLHTTHEERVGSPLLCCQTMSHRASSAAMLSLTTSKRPRVGFSILPRLGPAFFTPAVLTTPFDTVDSATALAGCRTGLGCGLRMPELDSR